MTEMVIQQLLIDAGATDVDQDLVMVEPKGLEVAADWRTLRSPETYLGLPPGDRLRVRTTSPGLTRRTRTPPPRGCLSTPGPSRGHGPSLRHAAVLDEPAGRIAFQFQARDVNLVMGPASRGAADPVPGLPRRPAAQRDAHGTDVAAGRQRDASTTSARIS